MLLLLILLFLLEIVIQNIEHDSWTVNWIRLLHSIMHLMSGNKDEFVFDYASNLLKHAL